MEGNDDCFFDSLTMTDRFCLGILERQQTDGQQAVEMGRPPVA